MSSVHEHLQPGSEALSHQMGPHLVAESGPASLELAEAVDWISMTESVLGMATLPLLMMAGAFFLLNILCLTWNVVFFLNSLVARRAVRQPDTSAAFGCRWGVETLPSFGNRTIWVCADCGATTRCDAPRPPALCQLRPVQHPPGQPPEGIAQC